MKEKRISHYLINIITICQLGHVPFESQPTNQYKTPAARHGTLNSRRRKEQNTQCNILIIHIIIINLIFIIYAQSNYKATGQRGKRKITNYKLLTFFTFIEIVYIFFRKKGLRRLIPNSAAVFFCLRCAFNFSFYFIYL